MLLRFSSLVVLEAQVNFIAIVSPPHIISVSSNSTTMIFKGTMIVICCFIVLMNSFIHDPPFPDASYLHNEDIYVGMSRNNRMSVVRRFFCLLVTFDLLLTGLMWLICMMVSSHSFVLHISNTGMSYFV